MFGVTWCNLLWNISSNCIPQLPCSKAGTLFHPIYIKCIVTKSSSLLQRNWMNTLNGAPNYMRRMVRANRQINREAFQSRDVFECADYWWTMFSAFLFIHNVIAQRWDGNSVEKCQTVCRQSMTVFHAQVYFILYTGAYVLLREYVLSVGIQKILKRVSSKETDSLDLLPLTFCLKFLIDRFAYLSFFVCHGPKGKYILPKGIKE